MQETDEFLTRQEAEELIGKLNKKLTWWPRIKKKVVAAGLIAGLLIPASIASFPAMVSWARNTKETQRLEQLCKKPIDEEIVATIRAESLEDFIYTKNPGAISTYKTPPDFFEFMMTDAHKKYDEVIQDVHKKTGIPKYILGAFVECGESNAWGMDALQWSWPGFVQINEDEAGLSARTLSQDKEQCLLSAAGEYQKRFSRVKDEIIALALLNHSEEEIKKAKSEAVTCKSSITQYQKWRKGEYQGSMYSESTRSDTLKQFDALVEKYHILIENTAILDNLDEKQALETEIRTLWKSTLPESDPRGYTERPNLDVYKVALRPKQLKRKQWWVENLRNLANRDCIKIALRLKKDGYK